MCLPWLKTFHLELQQSLIILYFYFCLAIELSIQSKISGLVNKNIKTFITLLMRVTLCDWGHELQFRFRSNYSNQLLKFVTTLHLLVNMYFQDNLLFVEIKRLFLSKPNAWLLTSKISYGLLGLGTFIANV